MAGKLAQLLAGSLGFSPQWPLHEAACGLS